MKLREVIAEVYAEVGLDSSVMDEAANRTSLQSVALFGRDVGEREVLPHEYAPLKSFLIRMLRDPSVFAEGRLRAMAFEEANRVDGVRN